MYRTACVDLVGYRACIWQVALATKLEWWSVSILIFLTCLQHSLDIPCQHVYMHNMPCKLCLQYADMHTQYVNMQYACDAQYPCAMWMHNSPKIKAHGVAYKRISLFLHVFGKDFEVGMFYVHDSILCTHVGILQIHADIGHEITTSCKVHWKEPTCSSSLKKIFPPLHAYSYEHSTELAEILWWTSFTETSIFLLQPQLSGFPLHFCYSDIQHVSTVESTGIHLCGNERIEYALAIYIHPYPNDVLSVWLYIASLIPK